MNKNTYFTDEEYRLVLSALGREREVCKKVDAEFSEKHHRLSDLMDSIERKIKDIQYDPPMMTNSYLYTLLNSVADYVSIGSNTRETIAVLMSMGFEEKDLMDVLHFSQSDIDYAKEDVDMEFT